MPRRISTSVSVRRSVRRSGTPTLERVLCASYVCRVSGLVIEWPRNWLRRSHSVPPVLLRKGCLLDLEASYWLLSSDLHASHKSRSRPQGSCIVISPTLMFSGFSSLLNTALSIIRFPSSHGYQKICQEHFFFHSFIPSADDSTGFSREGYCRVTPGALFFPIWSRYCRGIDGMNSSMEFLRDGKTLSTTKMLINPLSLALLRLGNGRKKGEKTRN